VGFSARCRFIRNPIYEPTGPSVCATAWAADLGSGVLEAVGRVPQEHREPLGRVGARPGFFLRPGGEVRPDPPTHPPTPRGSPTLKISLGPAPAAAAAAAAARPAGTTGAGRSPLPPLPPLVGGAKDCWDCCVSVGDVKRWNSRRCGTTTAIF